MKSRAPLFAGLAIVAVVAGAMSGVWVRSDSTPRITLTTGTLLPTPRPIPDFKLIDQHGQPFTRDQLLGRWSIIFFGFTHCPDVCPTTLTTLTQVDKALSDIPRDRRPKVVFISVDPRRDTPEVLARYVGFFNEQFVGLTGTQEQLDQLTKAMGVPVIIRDTGDGNYSVDHGAVAFAMDPEVRMAALFAPPHHVAPLAADIRTLINP